MVSGETETRNVMEREKKEIVTFLVDEIKVMAIRSINAIYEQ